MAETITALEWLGLPPHADARAVKREYALRLKQVRPDVDPAGFQFLHSVYQMALQQCAMRDAALSAAVESNADTEPASNPSHAVVEERSGAVSSVRSEHVAFASVSKIEQADPSVLDNQVSDLSAEANSPLSVPMTAETETLDFASFYAELLRVAAPGDGAAVSAWLLQQRALWSLRAKTDAAMHLIDVLRQDLPPLHEDAFDALLDFFDLHHVRSGLDPLAMQDLRRRLQLRWDFTPADIDERARRLRERHRDLYLSKETLATLLHRLARPLPSWRLLVMGAWPDTCRTYSRLLRGVLGMHPRELPDSMDRAQVQFWLAASDTSKLSLVRVGIALVQCMVGIAASAAAGFLLGLQVEGASHIVGDAALVGLVGAGLYLSLLIWRALAHWQSAHEMVEQPIPWRRWLFVPLLVGAGVACLALWTPLALVLFAVATSLAYARLRGRAGQPLFSNTFGIFSVLGLIYGSVGLLVLAATYPFLGAGVPLMLWTADAWRHRFLLRRR